MKKPFALRIPPIYLVAIVVLCGVISGYIYQYNKVASLWMFMLGLGVLVYTMHTIETRIIYYETKEKIK